jgi:hypothetical protein
MSYQKHCYWVSPPYAESIREGLRAKGFPLVEESHLPCRVLRSSVAAGWILPEAWGGICKRKTSWYQKSEKSTQSLIVSNLPLDLPGLGKPTMIRPSAFQPERTPSNGELDRLLASEEYRKRKPRTWDKPDPLEEQLYQRWFLRYRSKERFDFEAILRSHSANHANFLDPVHYVFMPSGKVPYSIAGSLYVCSSCLEFFGILGDQWRFKYVVPCIGAVQFARLPINQYFEVETA